MKRYLLPKAGLAVAFAALVVLGAGLFSATPAAADGPTIGVTSEEIKLDGEGKIVLWGDKFEEPGLGAWTIDIYYNPEVVNVVECGAEFGSVCNPEFHDNAVRITGSAAEGRKGEFALGSVWFSCKAEGETALELDIKVLADGTLGDPQPIEAIVKDGAAHCFEAKGLLGDADCDGELSSLDASWVLQYSAGLVDAVPCPDLADVNGDGNIDSIDSTIILQVVAGLLDKD